MAVGALMVEGDTRIHPKSHGADRDAPVLVEVDNVDGVDESAGEAEGGADDTGRAVNAAVLACERSVDGVLAVWTGIVAYVCAKDEIVWYSCGVVGPAGSALVWRWAEASGTGRMAGNASIVRCLPVHSIGTVDEALLSEIGIDDS